MKHPTTSNMLRFLPLELPSNTVWSDIEDTTDLTPGDWVFDPSDKVFYAGKVTGFVSEGWTEVMWHKSVDNIFLEFVPDSKLLKMWVASRGSTYNH
jgi:hypothetical protein